MIKKVKELKRKFDRMSDDDKLLVGMTAVACVSIAVAGVAVCRGDYYKANLKGLKKSVQDSIEEGANIFNKNQDVIQELVKEGKEGSEEHVAKCIENGFFLGGCATLEIVGNRIEEIL